LDIDHLRQDNRVLGEPYKNLAWKNGLAYFIQASAGKEKKVFIPRPVVAGGGQPFRLSRSKNFETKMKTNLFAFFFIVACHRQIRETEGRRIAVGPTGSIFSKPKGPSLFGSRPSGSGSIYARPVLGRNFGGFSGRQSSSGNGFGLGNSNFFVGRKCFEMLNNFEPLLFN